MSTNYLPLNRFEKDNIPYNELTSYKEPPSNNYYNHLEYSAELTKIKNDIFQIL